jgi:NTP pyrophosphatase (non-canonical NTP hydrolase)
MGDLGDLSKLIMAKKGYRFDQKNNIDEAIAGELADCLWALIVISDEFDIDLEDEFTRTVKKLESKISDRNIIKTRKFKRV